MPSRDQQGRRCKGRWILRKSRRCYCTRKFNQACLQPSHELKIMPGCALYPIRCLHWHLSVLAEHFKSRCKVCSWRIAQFDLIIGRATFNKLRENLIDRRTFTLGMRCAENLQLEWFWVDAVWNEGTPKFGQIPSANRKDLCDGTRLPWDYLLTLPSDVPNSCEVNSIRGWTNRARKGNEATEWHLAIDHYHLPWNPRLCCWQTRPSNQQGEPRNRIRLPLLPKPHDSTVSGQASRFVFGDNYTPIKPPGVPMSHGLEI